MSHINKRGNPYVVDTSKKDITERLAIASGEVKFDKDTYKKIKGEHYNLVKKIKDKNESLNMKLKEIIIEFMYQYMKLEEKFLNKKDMYELFLTLSGLNRFTTRYKKIPRDWLSIGFAGGVLEDLIVILRVAYQFDISTKHLISSTELIDGLKKVDKCRFSFISKVLEKLEEKDIPNYINQCLTLQGESKRINVYNGYYYAIQGIYGTVEFDRRVVTYLNDVKSAPHYGVHFTRKEIANNIWNKLPTTNSRSKGNPIPIGEIVIFNRIIHGLSCVDYENGNFVIEKSMAKIRDRMVHGIGVMERPKYESGLVIDIHKLIETLPKDSIMINEIGTLLIKKNVPRECIIDILKDDKLNIFWRI